MRLPPVLLLVVGGCGFSVPDIATAPAHPTYAQDVKPLLDDHCNVCHGGSGSRGAPGFALDTYAGAQRMAEEIAGSVMEDEMPPSAAWGDGVGPNGKKLLQNWVNDGAPP